MMHFLDASREEQAVSIVTRLSDAHTGVDPQVSTRFSLEVVLCVFQRVSFFH